MSEIVPVTLGEGRSYSIHIGAGLLAQSGRLAGDALGGTNGRQAVIITQPNIAGLYGQAVEQSLSEAGFGPVSTVTFAEGEEHKTLATVERLCSALYDLPVAVDRKTLIVALGGGVVGDVAGYVAAIYLRGLAYIQIPTTLLAMADSSVGGKTGVDFKSGKNLVGAFHQPRSVVIDSDVLRSLSVRDTRAGMAEIIKYGVISDADLLQFVETNADEILRLDADAIAHIVRRSCQIKADVVSRDEFETLGLRAILNYGHTIGHALESATDYKRFRHGEAVAIGMMAAAYIGEARNVTPPDVVLQTRNALQAFGLPAVLPSDVPADDLIALLGRDKKAEGGRAKFVLAETIGKVGVWGDVSEFMIHQGLEKAKSA